MAAYLQHDYDIAMSCLEQSIPIAREAEAMPLASVGLSFLGRTLFWVSGASNPRVLSLLEEGLALARGAHSHYAAGHALATLGDVRWAQGEASAALGLWREALDVVRELDDRRGIAGCLERLAVVLSTRGQFEHAAWLFGAAEGQHTALGLQRRADGEVDHSHFAAASEEDRLRTELPEAWAEGQAASVEASIQRALELTRT
jgi:hypothetical protein